MKHVRKALALMLAMFVSLVIAAPAFAAPVTSDLGNADNGSITVTNAEPQTYDLYKVFDATLDSTGTTPKIAYKVSADQLDDSKPHGGILNNTYFTDNFELAPDAATGPYVRIQQGKTVDPSSDAFKAFAEAFGDKVDTVDNTTTAGEEIQWTGLDFGYYYIKTTTGAAVTVDSTTPHADVIDKNPVTGIKKEITSPSHDLSSDHKSNSAALDEVITFQITADAKNYEKKEKVFAYFIEDTMDKEFSIVSAPVVTVGSKTLVAGTDYLITNGAVGDDNFTIDIPWTDDFDYSVDPKKQSTIDGTHLYKATDKIVVTYTAKLDPAKVPANYKPSNKNTAIIKPLKGTDTPTHTPPSGDQFPKDETKTYSTGITITKTDDANPAQPLPGAVFTLSRVDGGDLVAAINETTTTTPTYDPWVDGTSQGGKWYKSSKAAGGYTQDDPAQLKSTFVETDPQTWFDPTMAADPTGATPPTQAEINNAKQDVNNYEHNWADYDEWVSGMAPQNIPAYEQKGSSSTTTSYTAKGKGQAETSITATTNAQGVCSFEGLAPGEYKIVETTVPNGYIKAADHIYTVTFDTNNKQFTWTRTAPTAVAAATIAVDGVHADTIVDPIGTEFPETGGMGTRILYTVGGLMVAGAAIYLITKKRMASEA